MAKRNLQLIAQAAAAVIAKNLAATISGMQTQEALVRRSFALGEVFDTTLNTRYQVPEGEPKPKRDMNLIAQVASSVIAENVVLVLHGQQTEQGLVNRGFEVAELFEKELAARYLTPAPVEGEASSNEPKGEGKEPQKRPVVKKPTPNEPPSDPPPKAFRETSVDVLEIAEGTKTLLKDAGLPTVGHVIDCEKAKADEGGLSSLEGIGDTKREKILAAVEELRVKLGAPLPE